MKLCCAMLSGTPRRRPLQFENYRSALRFLRKSAKNCFIRPLHRSWSMGPTICTLWLNPGNCSRLS